MNDQHKPDPDFPTSRISLRVAAIALVLFFGSVAASHAERWANRVRVVHVPGTATVVKAQTGSDGTIHLLMDADNGPLYLRSQDGGATFSAPLSIVAAAAQKPGLRFSGWDMAVGKDGTVHVAMGNNAWKLKLPQDEWSLYYATFSRGAKAFSPVRNLNRKASEGFSLAANQSGGVAACFLSDKLFAMFSKDNGETFSASAELNPDWDPCNCCTTSATYGRDGRLALFYREESGNERDMYLVLWDQTARMKPSRTRVSTTSWKINACPMTYFTITATDRGYVAAWPTKGQAYFAKLDKDGAVLPPGEIQTPGTTGMRTGLLALSAPDGATLVAWKNKDTLGWQLYDAEGSPQENTGSEISPGNGAAAVVLPDGKFVVFP